jgi:hypothetical protein
MNTKTQTKIRPQLGTLAGVNERCELYGPAGANNLTVRKTYGKEDIRSLRLPLAQPQDKKVRAAHSGNGTPPYRPYLVYPGDPAHPGLPPGQCQISSLDYLPAHPGVGIKKPHGYAVFEEVATTGFEPVTKGL